MTLYHAKYSNCEKSSIMFFMSFWIWQPQRRNWSSLPSRLWNISVSFWGYTDHNKGVTAILKTRSQFIMHNRLTMEITSTEPFTSRCRRFAQTSMQNFHGYPRNSEGDAPTGGSAAEGKAVLHCWRQLEDSDTPGFIARALPLGGETSKKTDFLPCCWTTWTFQNQSLHKGF